MPEIIDLTPYFSPENLKEAYEDYKESKRDRYATDPEKMYYIPMGADGIDWQNFEINIDRRVSSISRAVLEGRYLFYPLREKEKEKPDGGTRILSIASIRDVLVQKQLYKALSKSSEAMFSASRLDKVSFGYRPGKSIRQVAGSIWRNMQRGFIYAVDADIKKFFDTLDHERLMTLIDEWVGLDSLAGKLLYRFIHVRSVPVDKKKKLNYFKTHKPNYEAHVRTIGVPQGGVLSGLLANLYLHSFDKWVVQALGSEIPLRYFRYADDFVVLTKSEQQAHLVYKLILPEIASLKLEMHPLENDKKTRIINIPEEVNLYNNKKARLKFVGFEFTKDHVRIRPETIQAFKSRFWKGLFREEKFTGDHVWWARLEPTIKYLVNPKITGPEPELCPICGRPLEPQRSWISVFASVVTDVRQIRELDFWMRKRVCKYFRDKHRVRLHRKHLREAGMKTMVNEYFKRREASEELCDCPTDK